MKTAGDLGELVLIQQIRRHAEASQTSYRGGRKRSSLVKLGIGDDCAILRPPPGHEVLVTTDFSLEGRHFRRDWHSPESIGHRALARGLSDVAAMGAKPVAAFLSLALPRDTPVRFISLFMKGFNDLAEETETILAGGDTCESPSHHILADMVLVGSAPTGTSLRRSTARPGDQIVVTGLLGGAAAELLKLSALTRVKQADRRTDSHPQLFPEPRLALGWALRRRGLATACMDLSDGLSSDLAKLCEASSVSAEIEVDALPMHPLALARGARSTSLGLHGGEDYELLFTVRPEARLPRSMAGVSITRIGTIVAKEKGRPRVVQVDRLGRRRPLPPGGWEHL